MKTLNVILLSSVVLALAGCGNQGGSSESRTTGYGNTSNTNYNPTRATNDYPASSRPARVDTGVDYNKNPPSVSTNDLGGATNSTRNGRQPLDPERTNNAPVF